MKRIYYGLLVAVVLAVGLRAIGPTTQFYVECGLWTWPWC